MKNFLTKKNINLKFFFYLIISILIGIFLVPKKMQNDTLASIKIGDYIIKNGYTIKEFLTYHNDFTFYNTRWLFDVITSFVHSHFRFFRYIYFYIIHFRNNWSFIILYWI